MSTHPSSSDSREFAFAALSEYCALVSTATLNLKTNAKIFDPEFGFGGQLLFVDALRSADRALLVAANVAGAASLVVAEEGGKQALRDGVVDFLVTTLDEALRILKNEIRKRQPVAVVVAATFSQVVAEMLERGVQPDFISSNQAEGADKFIALGACVVQPAQSQTVVCWQGTVQSRSLMAVVAHDCLPKDAITARRWLRLSARYLGQLAGRVRLVSCTAVEAENVVAALRTAITVEGLDATVEIVAGAN